MHVYLLANTFWHDLKALGHLTHKPDGDFIHIYPITILFLLLNTITLLTQLSHAFLQIQLSLKNYCLKFYPKISVSWKGKKDRLQEESSSRHGRGHQTDFLLQETQMEGFLWQCVVVWQHMSQHWQHQATSSANGFPLQSSPFKTLDLKQMLLFLQRGILWHKLYPHIPLWISTRVYIQLRR